MSSNQVFHSQLIDLRKWLKNTLLVKATTLLTIKDIYERYLLDLRVGTGSLEVKRKVFSKELRLYLKRDINSHRVRFTYKQEPIVEGIDLKK